jgi:C4-dicarboxylate-specific signal transduction histidine kinase
VYDIFKEINLLCIDDDKVVLKIFEQTFANLFQNVYTAANGLEGLKLYNEYQPDIIITDINMPKLDGMTLIKKIRQNDQNTYIYVISASEDANFFLRSIELGVSGYVIKPIDIQDILKKLEKAAKSILFEKQESKYKEDLKKLNILLEKKVDEKTAQLQELNRVLEHRVEEEVEKNFIAQKELFSQSKTTQIAELITNLSHQWRQPLSIISALAGGIKVNKELGIDDIAQEKKDLSQIVSTTKELSSTIEKLRIFTKNTEDKLDNFYVNDLIDNVINIVKFTYNEEGIELIREFHDTTEIKSFSKELATILLNLLSNAKDSINRSQKETRFIKISTRSVSADEQKDERCSEISIEDSGSGFDANRIEDIFNPYVSTKFQSKGVGLSLYIVKESVEKKFKGSIKALNTPNGAKITLQIKDLNT